MSRLGLAHQALNSARQAHWQWAFRPSVWHHYYWRVCGGLGFRLGQRMSSPLDFIPTREAALARLAEFLPAAGRYAAERNYVRPGHPNISRLSPCSAPAGVMPDTLYQD